MRQSHLRVAFEIEQAFSECGYYDRVAVLSTERTYSELGGTVWESWLMEFADLCVVAFDANKVRKLCWRINETSVEPSVERVISWLREKNS